MILIGYEIKQFCKESNMKLKNYHVDCFLIGRF
jgi:hypothetical protein